MDADSVQTHRQKKTGARVFTVHLMNRFVITCYRLLVPRTVSGKRSCLRKTIIIIGLFTIANLIFWTGWTLSAIKERQTRFKKFIEDSSDGINVGDSTIVPEFVLRDKRNTEPIMWSNRKKLFEKLMKKREKIKIDESAELLKQTLPPSNNPEDDSMDMIAVPIEAEATDKTIAEDNEEQDEENDGEDTDLSEPTPAATTTARDGEIVEEDAPEEPSTSELATSEEENTEEGEERSDRKHEDADDLENGDGEKDGTTTKDIDAPVIEEFGEPTAGQLQATSLLPTIKAVEKEDETRNNVQGIYQDKERKTDANTEEIDAPVIEDELDKPTLSQVQATSPLPTIKAGENDENTQGNERGIDDDTQGNERGIYQGTHMPTSMDNIRRSTESNIINNRDKSPMTTHEINSQDSSNFESRKRSATTKDPLQLQTTTRTLTDPTIATEGMNNKDNENINLQQQDRGEEEETENNNEDVENDNDDDENITQDNKEQPSTPHDITIITTITPTTMVDAGKTVENDHTVNSYDDAIYDRHNTDMPTSKVPKTVGNHDDNAAAKILSNSSRNNQEDLKNREEHVNEEERTQTIQNEREKKKAIAGNKENTELKKQQDTNREARENPKTLKDDDNAEKQTQHKVTQDYNDDSEKQKEGTKEPIRRQENHHNNVRESKVEGRMNDEDEGKEEEQRGHGEEQEKKNEHLNGEEQDENEEPIKRDKVENNIKDSRHTQGNVIPPQQEHREADDNDRRSTKPDSNPHKQTTPDNNENIGQRRNDEHREADSSLQRNDHRETTNENTIDNKVGRLDGEDATEANENIGGNRNKKNYDREPTPQRTPTYNRDNTNPSKVTGPEHKPAQENGGRKNGDEEKETSEKSEQEGDEEGDQKDENEEEVTPIATERSPIKVLSTSSPPTTKARTTPPPMTRPQSTYPPESRILPTPDSVERSLVSARPLHQRKQKTGKLKLLPLINMDDLYEAKPQVEIVIFVMTAISRIDRRQAIRETWWSRCKPPKAACFFITDGYIDESLYDDITAEQQQYKDILFLPTDEGLNFGLRLLYTMEWSLAKYKYDFFLRLDDDYFICIERLFNELPYLIKVKVAWGSWHCDTKYVVYLDESFMFLSHDLTSTFLSWDDNTLLCHAYGDQQLALWLNNITNVNAFHDYRLHHHPPASKYTHFKTMENICDRYLGLHGTYPDDMRGFWERSNDGPKRVYASRPLYPNTCRYRNNFDWSKIKKTYRQKPKYCINNPRWTRTREKWGGRQEGQLTYNKQ